MAIPYGRTPGCIGARAGRGSGRSGWGGESSGRSGRVWGQNKKMTVFGQKKTKTKQNKKTHNVFFWIIILIISEMNIIDCQFNLTSWSLFFH